MPEERFPEQSPASSDPNRPANELGNTESGGSESGSSESVPAWAEHTVADPDPTGAGTGGAGRSHVDQGEPADDAEHVRSGPMPSGEAHDLLVKLEQMGVESGLIRVDTAPAMGAVEVGRVDQAALARPVTRVALGAVAGAAIALVLGLIALAIWSLNPAPVILLTIIAGGLLGALWSLYGRLNANIEATDADTGYSTVHVATAELDDATNDRVRQAVSQSGQSSLSQSATGRPGQR